MDWLHWDWGVWGLLGAGLLPDWLWCVQLRRAFRSIRKALPQIFYVFLLFIFSLLIFSLMALKLLGKRCGSCGLCSLLLWVWPCGGRGFSCSFWTDT